MFFDPAMPAATVEPPTDAVYLCLDMQNLFAAGGIWQPPWMDRILPGIATLAAFNSARTVFARFVPSMDAADRPGRWQRYFTKWECVTRRHIDPDSLELVPALAALAPPAAVFDKPAYSAEIPTALDDASRKKLARLNDAKPEDSAVSTMPCR